MNRPASCSKSPFKSRSDLRRALTRVSAVASMALLFGGQDARAAARTWTGNTSTDWAVVDGFNAVPATGDSLVFGAAGTAGTTLTNTLTNTAFNIAGITFNAGASAYTMTGNTFNLTTGIVNSSSNLQTFNNTGVAPVTGSTGGTVSNATGLTSVAATTWNVGTAGITLSGLQFSTTNNASATTTVNGTGGTLTIGYLGLGTNTVSRLVDNFAGTGNISVGTMAPGGSASLTSDSFSYGGTGTFTLTGGHTGGTFSDAINSGTFVLSGNEGSGLGINGAAVFTETSTGVLSGTAAFGYNSTATTSTLAGANTLTGAITVGAGALTLSGSINAANATTGSSITVNGGTFNETSTGVLNGSGSGATAGGQITLNAGAVDLQGANNTTGNITVNGGTLTVDSTGGTTANVLKTNGTTLIMGNGTTNFLLSANATANTETVYQTQFLANTSSLVEVTQNGNTSTTGVINLGNTAAFARNAASITDFGTLPTGGTVLENTSSKANSINGVLASNTSTTGVAFATVGGGTNFASINATTGVIGTVAPVASTYGATVNAGVGANDTPASGAGANTLTFAGTTGATLTFTGLNTITAGGILVTPTTTGTTTITGGTIRGGVGKELVVINNEPNTAGSLTISSIIADSTSGSSALTIGSTLGAAGIAANPQRTILTAANTFTGQTTLLNGTLNLSNQLALQGSTFQSNTGTTLVFDQSVTGNAFTLGGLSGSTNIALVNNAATPAPIALTLNVATGGSPQYNGVLSGAGATLTKTGAGTETLGGANTYTGVTTINGGILQLGNATAGKILNTSGVVTAAGGSLAFNGGNNGSSESAQVGGVVSGTGGITDNQGNQNTTFNLDKANTYTGPTVVAQRGILTSSVAAAYDANGNMISSGFGVNSALVFNSPTANVGETVLLSSNSQLGSLSTGASTVAVSSGNGVILNGFNLITGGDNTSTTFNAQISGGPIPNGGTTTGTRNIGGNLTKIGTGTQTLGGANLYSGITTITGGTLAVTTLTNGGIATTGSITTGTNQLTVNNATGLAVGQVIQSTVLAGSAETITAINGNVLTLSGNASATLTNGPIVGGAGNGLGISTNAAANLVLDGGTLQYTGAATSTDRLFTVGAAEAGGATGTLDASGTGAVNFTNTGAVAYGTTGQARTLGLTGTNTGANTLAAVIGDNGAGVVNVTKNGVGTWALTGTNTYSGTTSVNAGTLLINGNNRGATGMVAAGNGMGSNGTLGGTGVVGGAVMINPGSTITGATNGTIGMLTLASTLSLSGTYAVDLAGASTSDVLAITGIATFTSSANLTFAGTTDGTTYTLATYASDTGFSNLVTNSTVPSGYSLVDTGTALELVAVPEPSTWVAGITCLGMVGAWLMNSRRKSRRAA